MRHFYILIVFISLTNVFYALCNTPSLTVYSKYAASNSYCILNDMLNLDSLSHDGYIKINVSDTYWMYDYDNFMEYFDSLEMVSEHIEKFHVNLYCIITNGERKDSIAFGFHKYNVYFPDRLLYEYDVFYYNGKFYKINWEIFNALIYCLPHDHKFVLDYYFSTCKFRGF